MSAIFFGGLPRKILEMFSDGKFELVISKVIYEEYLETAEVLSERYPGLQYKTLLERLVKKAHFVVAPPFNECVCKDPDDDIYLEAAVASGATVISTGDKLLLACDGFRGIRILKPRDLLDLLN